MGRFRPCSRPSSAISSGALAGTLVGVLFAVAGSMAGWGPWIAGAIYDATGSYAPAFRLAAALNALAIGLLLLCRPPRLAYPALASPRESATSPGDARRPTGAGLAAT